MTNSFSCSVFVPVNENGFLIFKCLLGVFNELLNTFYKLNSTKRIIAKRIIANSLDERKLCAKLSKMFKKSLQKLLVKKFLLQLYYIGNSYSNGSSISMKIDICWDIMFKSFNIRTNFIQYSQVDSISKTSDEKRSSKDPKTWDQVSEYMKNKRASF